MADYRGLNPPAGPEGPSRRRAMGMMGIGTLALVGAVTGCGRDDRAAVSGPGPGAQASANEQEGPGPAPELTAARTAVSGQAVQPVTGLTIGLPANASAFTPERLGDGRTQVPYAWTEGRAWGYLAVEGPASFEVRDDSAAKNAAHAEGQRLIASLIAPSEAKALPWSGFTQCVQMTWNQLTTPPGWQEQVSADAIGLFLVDRTGRSYTVVAYAARGELTASNPAVSALCSTSSAG